MGEQLRQNLTPGLKHAHSLMASPRMRQALEILQLPATDLAGKVNSELERNPLLSIEEIEGDEPADIQMEALLNETQTPWDAGETPVDQSLAFRDEDYEVFRRLDEEFRDHFIEGGSVWRRASTEERESLDYNEAKITAEATLFAALMQQAHDTFEEEDEIRMAEAIIGNLDDNGFLTTPLDEIAAWAAVEEEDLHAILASIQTFSPSGVGAADVRESLLLQLQHQDKWHSLAYRIVDEAYDLLMHNRIPAIAKRIDVSKREVTKALEHDLSQLTLFPGHLHARDFAQPLIPDIVITELDGQLRTEVSEGDLPTLRLNRTYLDMLEDPTLPKETRHYLQRRLASAKWLIHNIDRRNRTLDRLGEVLIRWQEPYLRSIEGKLRPMTMRAIADELGVNESTVARAVSGKTLSCPRGTFMLRSLFSGSYETDQGTEVSASSVRDIIERLIDAEDKQHPLTDHQISKELADRGIRCARRTVAKYRHQLGHPSANYRRR